MDQTTRLLICLLIFEVASAFNFPKLELIQSPNETEIARSDPRIESNTGLYLFEVNNDQDCVHLMKVLYWQLKRGVWLGSLYSQQKGWYNPSTQQRNDFLNWKANLTKPTSIFCLMAKVMEEISTRTSFVQLEKADCKEKHPGAWAFMRSRLFDAELELQNLRNEFDNYRNGRGNTVIHMG